MRMKFEKWGELKLRRVVIEPS